MRGYLHYCRSSLNLRLVAADVKETPRTDPSGLGWVPGPRLASVGSCCVMSASDVLNARDLVMADAVLALRDSVVSVFLLSLIHI